MTIADHFFWIAVILLLSRISSLIERFGQPAVLGELFVGIVLGNLVLMGWHTAEPLKHEPVIHFLAQLGVVILLFQVGLESNIDEIQRVGPRVVVVAIIGVALPFFLGYAVIPPILLPDMTSNGRLFLGAMLSATSVGITARVFKDRDQLQSREASIVLGAAVIDDVLCLSLLAILKAMVESGNIGIPAVGWIALKAVMFLAGAIVLGQLLAVRLGRLLSHIHPGVGMKFILAICFCLVFAFLADWAGLAPIVGAFAAGLVLKPVTFTHFDDPAIVDDVEAAIEDSRPHVHTRVVGVLETYAESHVETLVKPLGFFLVPLFFVMTGMEVNLKVFLDPRILLLALGLSLAGFGGKLIAGLSAGKVNKMVVGWGLVPRGEVTLIFAATGKALGVLSDALFAAMIVMVVISTLMVPPVLNLLLRRQSEKTVGKI